jgi:hypothetical protein
VARANRDRVGAGAQLHAQAPVGLEPSGQVAAARERHEAGRLHGPEYDLARAPRGAQEEVRLELERHLVHDAAEDPDVERVLGRRLGGARLEPQAPRGVARGQRHGDAVERQRHDRGRRRHRQRRGPRAPDEAPVELVAAGLQPRQGRGARNHRERPPSRAQLLRAQRGVAGKRHPGARAEHLEALREARRAGVDVERERAGEHALRRGYAHERRAVGLLHPLDPRTQRFGDRVEVERLGGALRLGARGDRARQQQRRRRRATAQARALALRPLRALSWM